MLFTTILLGLNLAGVDSLAVMIGLLFLGFAVMGLVIPSTMVLALEEHGPIAGIASALGGTLQMVTGGIMIVIVSAVFDGTARPMVATVALCAIGALLLSFATMGRRELAPQLAE
jgi:MFS transporter, DHA1 family, multidrug resistance protein